MRHRGWFVLTLKAIGVAFAALALAGLLPEIAAYWRDVRELRQMVLEGSAFGKSTLRRDFLIQAAPYALQLAIGLYLVLDGRLVLRLCIPPNRPYCPACGYDLSHCNATAECRECGQRLAETQRDGSA